MATGQADAFPRKISVTNFSSFIFHRTETGKISFDLVMITLALLLSAHTRDC